MEPLPHTSFATAARASCPTHAQLALALGHDLMGGDLEDLEAALDRLADEMHGADTLPAREQIAEVAITMEAFATRDSVIGHRGLTVDSVLATGEGHPLALAVIAVEVARRAGVELGIAQHAGGHVVAHRQVAEPMALDFSRPADDRVCVAPVGQLRWRCSHQIAFTILGELVRRGRRGGDLPLALRAAELRLAMPMKDDARTTERRMFAQLRATLN
ncbi:MAG: hypothetical protein JHC95_08030 [Solirubrobacteraceae bacterium]|nr:hypothetical protein [Solirubrobacteraceae bacterium]